MGMITAQETGGRPRPRFSCADYAALPADLKGLPNWVGFRLSWVTDKQGKRKLRKVPVDGAIPNDSKNGKTKAVDTWRSFAAAQQLLARGAAHVLGFALPSDQSITGIDLDHCLRAGDTLAAWAEPIVARFAGHTYIEVTPSGEGLRIYVHAHKPGTECKRVLDAASDGAVELYDHARFFTVTGHAYQDAPLVLAALPDEVAALYDELFPAPPARVASPHASANAPEATRAMDDEELLTHARNAKNGSHFRALFDAGDLTAYGGDHSAADLALCSILAFWSGPDRDRIDRLFRRSALMRDKWEREDYRNATIGEALAKRTEFYEPARQRRSRRRHLISLTEQPAGDGSGAEPKHADRPEPPYVATDEGLFWRRPSREARGGMATQLTNFTARIAADVTLDDGAEKRRVFVIEANLRERHIRFDLPAEHFAAMSWPTAYLGPMAIVYSGSAIKDNARVAIQLLSGTIPAQQVFTHMGWRELDDARWVYLHAGGAIGPGEYRGVSVALPDDLAHYHLPEPPQDEELQQSIRASLACLEVAPDHVSIPPYAALWRAVLGGADCSVHLTGRTGEGKSELAALMQQHFGATMDARHLPASWSSTGNALEALTFAAKDALLVVDDFIATGSAVDVQRKHQDADRVFRGVGNHSGRGRMRPDGTLRPTKPPQGLVLSTGEDIPRGESLRSRLLVVELSPGDIDWDRLTQCQSDAASGFYAQALAGYITWLARDYAARHAGLRAAITALRQQASRSAAHRRTPEIVANLVLGMRTFLEYAAEVGAITSTAADAVLARVWAALGELARQQAAHQAASDPVRRFLELVNTALGAGEAHLQRPDGGGKPGPDDALHGWQPRLVGTGENIREDWWPQGRCVGWLDGDNLYLEPNEAYKIAQSLARDTGDPLVISLQTLIKRISERGLLASTEPKRESLRVRRKVGGLTRTVLHLHAAILSTDAEPDKPDIENTDSPELAEEKTRMSGAMSGLSGGPTRDPTSMRPEPMGLTGDNVGFVGRSVVRGTDVVREDEDRVRVAQPLSRSVSGRVQNPTFDPTSSPTWDGGGDSGDSWGGADITEA